MTGKKQQSKLRFNRICAFKVKALLWCNTSLSVIQEPILSSVVCEGCLCGIQVMESPCIPLLSNPGWAPH